MKNKWISLLLSLLGFAAAGCEEARVEYGSPYATYTLKGKVTDMNGKAISGIRVTLRDEATRMRRGLSPARETACTEFPTQ